jgi:CheY-like chemotaxis protein
MAMQNVRDGVSTVLYVEDNADDYALLELAASRCGTPFYLQRTVDGEDAIAYLNGAHPYSDRETHPFPNLVLLDLRLPRLDGFEVLQWMRDNPRTRDVPVVVLAGSRFRADIRRALELGARSYAAKPSTLAELEVLVEHIAKVWLAREQIVA